MKSDSKNKNPYFMWAYINPTRHYHVVVAVAVIIVLFLFILGCQQRTDLRQRSCALVIGWCCTFKNEIKLNNTNTNSIDLSSWRFFCSFNYNSTMAGMDNSEFGQSQRKCAWIEIHRWLSVCWSHMYNYISHTSHTTVYHTKIGIMFIIA